MGFPDGLYGFNAVLVGLAIGTFCEDAKSEELTLLAHAAFLCMFFGVLSSLVLNSLAKWMPTPAFTLPFNICIMWFFGGTWAYSNMSTDISPHLSIPVTGAKSCLRSA